MKRLHDFDAVLDTQRVFRLILDAMANPARTVDIAPYAARFHEGCGALLAIGLTLLDNETTFCAVGDEALENSLLSLTMARRAPLAQADYVFLPHAGDAQAAIPQVKYGTAVSPHLSATVVVLDGGAGAHAMRLQGPGIDGVAAFMATDAAREALDARDAQHYPYPQGIDLLLVTESGALTALPRLTVREVR